MFIGVSFLQMNILLIGGQYFFKEKNIEFILNMSFSIDLYCEQNLIWLKK